MKKECLKLNKRLFRKTKSATWNCFKQFDVDIDKSRAKKLNVMDFYMPQELQDEVKEWCLKNSTVYKVYTKKYAKKQIAWESLCYFPSSVWTLK